MTYMSSGPVFVAHRTGSIIVDVQRCRTFSQGIEFCKNISEILGGFGGSDFCVELCLCQDAGNNKLDTTLPCDVGTAKNE